MRISGILKKSASRKFSAFTLAELIVVVSILAVLATIGFLALSGYQKDAKKAVASSNVRSVYAAISSESAVTGYSSRYYVVHDPLVALSGAVVVFDGHPASLVGGNWDAPGTNYSAGNPDYAKLKLDPEKFRITSSGTRTAGLFAAAFPGFPPFGDSASGEAVPAAVPSYLLVGAADATDASGGKDRVRSYTQVAALLPSGETAVTGDYPVSASGGSTPGLILDTANPSGTGALIDGATVGSIPGCDAASVSGYDVSAMESGESKPVSKTITNGEVNATAYCSFGALSVSSEAAACASGFVPASGPSCVENVCGGTAPSAGAHTETNASSQAVGTSWHYAASAGTCTYACVSGYSWDSGSSSCKADCTGLAYDYHGGFAGQYALSSIPALVHGASGNFSGTGSFGDSVSSTDGELTATFAYTCTDGVLAKNSTDGTGSCTSPNYTWNSSWSAPACTGNSVTNQSCTGLLATGAVWNTASAITQTWSGGVLVPSLAGTYDETASTAECRYKCDSGYAWDSGSSACRAHCASSTPTV
ncbi:MAG: hypothetical protein QG650_1100 [Patescibacteria group bacterium]|nr:hypothetical protein [Patescibacteria group bacterium]